MNIYDQLSKKMGLTGLYDGILQLTAGLLALYIISFYNYVLFHSLAETATVTISVAIFFVVWNARKFMQNNYLLVIGIAFGAISVLDLIHAFAYKGVSIIETGGNSNIATQLWIASRYIASTTFLIAPFFMEKIIKGKSLLSVYLIIVAALLLSIFFWKNFPPAFIEGKGLTQFKIYSEYFISLIFLAAMFSLYQIRKSFDSRVYHLLNLVLLANIASELMFTLYVSVYDKANMIGHLLRLVSVYLSYLAILEYSLKRPYRSMFKTLKESEQKLKFEQSKLNNILGSMGDGVIMIDKDYRILYANHSLVREFGYYSGTKKCYEYLHGQDQPCDWCKNKEVFQGFPVRWECFFQFRNKTYEIIETPMETEDGEPAKLELFHDITERKELEKSKDEFISLASHQLRTPLASLSLSSELLLRGTAGPVDGNQRGYLEEINQSTKKMTALVNNLLNVSRLELGTFPINQEPVNINALLLDIVREIAPQVKEKKIRLETKLMDTVPIIQSDSNVIHILLENILSNSLRYTPTEGRISLKTYIQNSGITIEISDSGCGIPKEQQSLIFSKSFRATNAIKTCADGTGLGLYMVKTIAEKLEYGIDFISEEGKGTTFYVKIPLPR